ncbi:MAG: redox-sensing transcriptional repressor Rex [Lentisphaerae bacterium]|jgi:redox-sensing transcriptional repressor|nr:redox-sensing transcriptional repressor Rex [Lentisphaerota bacterium]
MGRVKVQNSPTIRRMPSYLHELLRMRMEGRSHVSTTELAECMGIELIVVRKDIALTGITGRRRIGYEVNELITYIKDYLGWSGRITATLLGVGALGSAILGYDEFPVYGLHIESVFDSDPEKIGQVIRGREVYDIATIRQRLSYSPPDMAIICVPSVHAQEVAEQAVAVGIKYIWNFSNTSLKVAPGVIVQREVIAGGLAMLTVKMKNDKAGIYQKIE